MTAFELIDQIFARPQEGVPGNERRITQKQYDYLKSLIDENEEGGAVARFSSHEIVWMPSGRNKYILREQSLTTRRAIVRLASTAPVGAGKLF